MRTIALKSRLLRATSTVLALALAGLPADAQLRPGAAERAKELNQEQANPNLINPNNAAAAAAANPAATPNTTPEAPKRLIQHIVVQGTQRVEPGTVLTYVNIREGDPYDPATADTALKALYATGLFSDANYRFNEATGTLTIRVTENPIVNQVVFEGNSKVSDKDLTKEVQIKPRSVFTRAKVQADVQRIIELYRRNGKFAARVDPQIIQRPQNRVDLIFSITDGPTTGVARINFIGNHVYDSDTLRGQIATEESRWWKFLASNDNYDPDRLAFDREQLRRYYANHGYADFRVVSAVAELTPDKSAFYITFTVDEGMKYKFGKVTIDSKIKELPPSQLLPSVGIKGGDVYAQQKVQKAIDNLTNAAGTKGYAFAEVHPRIQRDRATRTINMSFDIVQGPRVYIEKIDIAGNTRTLDKVIRREFRLVEGDAFNRVLIDRSRTRIRSLGFFKDVDIKNTPGSQPDRTDITVNVTEQSTGSLSLGLGYSSVSQLVGEFSYTEINMFGRGQNLRASVEVSQIQKQYQLSFTEPWFLDRPLSAGFDIYKVQTDFEFSTYESDVIAGVLRVGFPISEYSSVGLNYMYKIEDILPFSNAPAEVLAASGRINGSVISFSYGYNDLDDVRKPTDGVAFSLKQGFAGFGGNLKFLQTDLGFDSYTPMFDGAMVGSFSVKAGMISGYDGAVVPFEDRYFDGGDTFRGFALAGIGPRDINQFKNYGAVGGTVHAIGTFAVRMPSLLPESYGINAGLFTDFGTLGRVDTRQPGNCTTGLPYSGVGTCVKDNLAFRASAGISVQWKSPFGPVQIDIGIPYIKTKYDRPQILHFTGGTGF